MSVLKEHVWPFSEAACCSLFPSWHGVFIYNF